MCSMIVKGRGHPILANPRGCAKQHRHSRNEISTLKRKDRQANHCASTYCGGNCLYLKIKI